LGAVRLFVPQHGQDHIAAPTSEADAGGVVALTSPSAVEAMETWAPWCQEALLNHCRGRCPRYADHEQEVLVGHGERAERVGILQHAVDGSLLDRRASGATGRRDIPTPRPGGMAAISVALIAYWGDSLGRSLDPRNARVSFASCISPRIESRMVLVASCAELGGTTVRFSAA
jgi:hypothetical protein